jgi:hypothetical protein
VTKLKKTSIKTYFFERTAGGPKSSTFYPTIKPFLSNKGMKSNNSIILCENDKIVNDPKEVTEIFNNFFFNGICYYWLCKFNDFRRNTIIPCSFFNV